MKIKTKEPWYFHGTKSGVSANGRPVIETAVYHGSIVHPTATIRITLENSDCWPDKYDTSRQLNDAEVKTILKQLGLK